jgi:hypothetical protein
MKNFSTLSDLFGTPISQYTRKQAIDDGVLIDVTEFSKQFGFCISVAMTNTVWLDCVRWTEADNKRQTYQDESGRLTDVLSMARFAIRKNSNVSRLPFQVYRVPAKGRGTKPKLVELHMHIGPGDNAEPVITIMMPNED